MQNSKQKITHAIIDDEANGRVEVRITFRTIFRKKCHIDIPPRGKAISNLSATN